MLFTKQTKPTLFSIPFYSLLKQKKVHTHIVQSKLGIDITNMLAANYRVLKINTQNHSRTGVPGVYHQCFHVSNLSLSVDEVVPSCHQRNLACSSLEKREQRMCLAYRTKEFVLSLAFTAGENGSWCAELHDKCAPSSSLLPL